MQPMLKQPTHLGFSITADSTHFGPSTSNQTAFSEGAYVNTIRNTPAMHNQLPNPPSVNLQGYGTLIQQVEGGGDPRSHKPAVKEVVQSQWRCSRVTCCQQCYKTTNSSSWRPGQQEEHEHGSKG
uniref:Uncharacterized protein n=1 Tax=Tanacetum cinerariifolium TaxID=118510 RepID=A0A6L2JA88_TANCI|nr:hypothetical protein [Tanacetum cinerariifolium]